MARSLLGQRQVAVELNISAVGRRILEMIPGVLSWGTLIGLTVLSAITPFVIAVFVIVYDLYVLIRGLYLSIHLVYAYRRLAREQKLDWLKRCQWISDQPLGETIAQLEHKTGGAYLERRERQEFLEDLQALRSAGGQVIPWKEVHHIVLYPTYNESITVLKASLTSLKQTAFPKERLHVVVGFEERIGQAARDRAAALQQEFGNVFGTFMTTFHPDGLPGEARVKSANATWAVQRMEEALPNVPVDRILVSNFDSDTVVSASYFAHLTYKFISHPNRWRVSYQPLPMYNNNLWDAPAFSRVIATGSTFWQMIESTRPERLVTFSSHSMTLRALKEVGYWTKNVISEDSRIFWQCLLHYNGNYRTEPLYTTVSMDAALAGTWWQTLKNQYKQKRRWAWGIENFPYLAEGFWRNKSIPRYTKFTYIFRTLEGHHSWATAPIIVAGLGWLPIFFGGPDFHVTVLSYSLPFIARTIMSVAMAGLLISTLLSFLLLPPRPKDFSRWRYVLIAFQWALVPLIAAALSALPALDAETRLMFGRGLQFNVMEKSRKR